MAVLLVTTYQVHAGGRQEFLKNLAELKKLAERHGAKWRAWQSDLAGANAGRVSATTELDDYAAYARWRDAMAADSEYQAFLARFQANTDPPITIVSRASATEVLL